MTRRHQRTTTIIRRALPAATLAALVAPAPCQQAVSLVVPATYETAEAPNTAFWALSPFAARRQLLIDERHLPGLRGKRIKALLLRRNGLDNDALSSGVIRLEVTLSHAQTNADAASDVFAQNRESTATAAFSGAIAIPAAPAQSTPPAPWAVRIELRRPFLYNGGTLCIETETNPVTTGPHTPWWPIDAVVDPSSAKIATLGRSCIPGMPGTPANADASGFVPGATATFSLLGSTTETAALCVIGLSSKRWGTTPLPLDLTPLGAPGCEIYVDLRFVLPVPLVRLPAASLAYASWSARLPETPAIVGLSVYNQWAIGTGTNTFGLATSNAVRCVIGAPTSLTGLSWVESTDVQAANGRVLRGRFPVLRLEALAP